MTPLPPARPALQPLLGLMVLAAISAAVLGALVTLGVRGIGEPFSLADPYLLSVLRFTLFQAALSTLLAVAGAIPLARALARRPQFAGRSLLLRLFALPLVMPAIVVALAMVTLFGQAGWLNGLLRTLGLPGVSIYGLPGILLAHCFFNLPLAARILLTVLDRIPAEQWRLAQQLGLSPATCFARIEFPALMRALPGVMVLIFLLCLGSFTIVLTLGGGPAATTLEVAVYEALRSSFEPGRAAQLAMIQLSLTVICLLVARRFVVPWPQGHGSGRPVRRLDGESRPARWSDAILISLGALVISLPLASILIDGMNGPVVRLLSDPDLHRATLRTLGIALCAGPLSVLLAWGLLTAARAARGRLRLLLSQGGDVVLTVPPLVLGTGWFLLIQPLTAPETVRWLLVVVLNALMALPFVLRSLGPALMQAAADQDRLCAALDITGWRRFRLIDAPSLRRPLGLALGIAAALAAGDFAAVALIGADSSDALPLLLHARMGSYRLNDAAVIAVILTLVGLMLLMILEWGGRRIGHRHRT